MWYCPTHVFRPAYIHGIGEMCCNLWYAFIQSYHRQHLQCRAPSPKGRSTLLWGHGPVDEVSNDAAELHQVLDLPTEEG